MADPGTGRGRGLALLQAIKKSREAESPSQSSPDATPTPSVATSMLSCSTATTTTLGGRGRVAAMMSKLHQKPGGDAPIGPASDASPAISAIRGAGRGLKLLQSLKAQAAKPPPSDAGHSVSGVTQQMSRTTISQTTAQDSSVSKNKYFREVKDTPPVVMKGTTGTPCLVSANYIHLQFEENSVFEYHIEFEPEQDYRSLRFKLLNEHNRYFKEKTFDGTTMYVPHQLPEEALDLVSTNPFDSSKVNIKIKFRRTRRLSEMIHIYNVLFKHIMKDLELVRFGRQHFSQQAAIQIPQHKLEVWPGFVTAVDEYEGGLMLTLDSAHRVLRTQPVLDFIKEIVQKEGSNWKKIVAERLIGTSVMTTYNNKLFRVDSIDDSITPQSTFEKNEKGELVKISYIDYYKKNYGIQIMDWNQPMLISKDTKRMSGNEEPTDFMICLVPELCQLTGLTDDQRSNMRLMKDVATYTRITPNQRHSAFKKYIQNVMSNDAARSRLKGWGLSIAPETIDLTARTLPPEPIVFGNDVRVPGKPNAEWNAEVSRNSVIQAVDIMRWAILFTDRDKKVTMEFLDVLRRCCNPMGINVSQPQLVRLANDRTESYINALKETINTQLQLVVVIFPTARDDRYAAVKKICCADMPVPSQVINARTIMNQAKVRSITQKILLQINCKLGGTLWGITIPCKSAMIVGIDTYHEANRKSRSVGAFVASYNSAMTHWYSKAVFQGHGQELLDNIIACYVQSLNHYLRTNGNLPDKIIIYRDGVGDGQLKVIREYEVPQMETCYDLVQPGYRPALTYVIVQKRINTRIFLKAGREHANPPPGTVLDHGVTRRDWYDFLVVSQKVTQGTVTPTHYIVVHDGIGMSPDQCQRLTYKLCHLYYNWPGTVRVPAPVQYAHKLAALVGQYMHQTPADLLADKLFFL